MQRMSNFEKKFGKYAIPNLSTLLILCYAVGYVIELINTDFIVYMTLDPYQILFHGQIWRLFTWIIIPPSSGNFFLVLIMLYFYWSIGTTLERTWGTYRYNVYLFSGMLMTILGSFLCVAYYLIFHQTELGLFSDVQIQQFFLGGSQYFSTYYINMSIFLAFAATFPDSQVLLMFIIPLKVKWLGVAYGVLLVFEFLQSRSNFQRYALAFSLLNFALFFFTSRNRIIKSPKQMRRQHAYKKEVHQATNTVTRHKCAICGRTDESNPELEFRFCSKCNGNYEYCQEHLFTHKHVM